MDYYFPALSLLLQEHVVVIPTDTVYGVVGQLASERAVARIYELKQRDFNKPVGTILAGSLAQVRALTTMKNLDAVAHMWPGPVSVILPSDRYPYAHKGEASFAIRIPDNPALRELLEHTGPLASSSANLQGMPPATTVELAKSYFHNQIPLYIDGGDLSDRRPSQILRPLPDGSFETVRSI